MSTTELGQTIALTSYVFRLFKAYWAALQERRERARLRTVLDDLSDGELWDIGITRGEIDYVTLNRSIDPRGVDIGLRVTLGNNPQRSP